MSGSLPERHVKCSRLFAVAIQCRGRCNLVPLHLSLQHMPQAVARRNSNILVVDSAPFLATYYLGLFSIEYTQISQRTYKIAWLSPWLFATIIISLSVR